MSYWVLVLIIAGHGDFQGSFARLNQETYYTKAQCEDALREAARTNYTSGFYWCQLKEGRGVRK